jgi:hypothetical protein
MEATCPTALGVGWHMRTALARSTRLLTMMLHNRSITEVPSETGLPSDCRSRSYLLAAWRGVGVHPPDGLPVT